MRILSIVGVGGRFVLDMRAEQHEAGQPYPDLYEAVAGLKHRHDLHPCSVRPGDGLALRRDAEREVVQDLVKRFRDLPADQRRRLPALLNSLAQLEIVVGDLEAGQQDFQEVARLVADPISQAEAYHNVYRAALERRDFAVALPALRRAAALDPDEFEPFPFARYEPIRLLGAGGFGAAFLCHDREADARVVVRALRPEALDREADAVFRDAAAARELDHPALVRVRDAAWAGPEKARPYLVMDYFEGQTLGEYVARHGALPPEEWLAIAWQVGRALQALHGRGVLHRSLRPSAVLMRKEPPTLGPSPPRREGGRWRVGLLDAGLALKRTAIHASASNPAARVQTSLGRSVVRAIAYAAPEVVGRPKGQVWVGPHSDVYAFGKLSAFALTGRPDPDGGDLVLLDEPWKQLLAALAGWTIPRRPPHFGAVLDLLARLPGAKEITAAAERDLNESAVAEQTAALAADPRDVAALARRAAAHARQGDAEKAVADFTAALRLRPDDAALLLHRGQLHARAHDHDKAVSDFDEAVRLEPRNAEALAARALSQAQRGEHDRAVADFTEALRLNPKEPALYFNRGNAYFGKGDYERAAADYGEAVRLDPRNAWAYGARGKAHALRGEHARAVADFGRLLHLDPANVRALWDRAVSHAALSQFDRALADYDAAVRREPSATLLLERGQTHAAVGDLEKAVADFTEALALDPKQVGAYLARAAVYQGRGEFGPALADLDEAVKLWPDSAPVLTRRGEVRHRLGLFDEAVADYTRSLELGPDQPDVCVKRGIAEAAAGRCDAALADYTAAIRQDPGNASAFLERGKIHAGRGDHESALADFNEAVRLGPADTACYARRAAVREAAGDPAGAIDDYSESIRLDPADAHARFRRGVVRAGIGDLEGALADLGDALRLQPDHARAFAGRAEIQSRLNELDRALADYSEALRFDPNDLTAYHGRARVYLRLGDYSKAAADHLEALRRAPDDVRTLNNLAWLLATDPQTERRDPARAEEYARRAVELSGGREAAYVDTLAAACAAGGKLDEAAEWQRKAVELAAESEKADYQTRLTRYDGGQPLSPP